MFSNRGLVAIIFAIVGSVVGFSDLVAQGEGSPLFGPPVEAEKKPRTDEGPTQEKKSATRPGEYGALIDQLVHWPTGRGHEVARKIIVEGRGAVPELIIALEDNDWRVRAGSAFALGELGAASAFPVLAEKAKQVGNKISAETWFRALVQIDPIQGTAVLLPFIESSAARVARDAFESLPKSIDPRFDEGLRRLAVHQNDLVRFRALQLISRVAGPLRADPFLARLGDRAPRVARFAAEVVSEFDDPKVQADLISMARTGRLRAASYALLALTMAEDRSRTRILPADPEFVTRLLQLLKIRGNLENAAAAIAGTNLARRSSDPRLQKAANALIPFRLIKSAAGGELFRDFGSVQKMCFEKIALLTGESFGRDGDAWKRWWVNEGKSFVAIRELADVPEAAVGRLIVDFFRRSGDSAGRRRRLVVENADADDAAFDTNTILLTPAEMRTLRDLILSSGYFQGQGEPDAADWTGDLTEISLRLDRSSCRRLHRGAVPTNLEPLVARLQAFCEDNRWQLFHRPRTDGTRSAWIRAQRNARQSQSEADRRSREADLALRAYAELEPAARRAAVSAIKAAGADFARKRRADILALATPESFQIGGTRDLARLLLIYPEPKVTDRVVDCIDLDEPSQIAVLAEFLEARPVDDRRRLLSHADNRLRLEALNSLSDELARPEVKSAVIAELDRGSSRELGRLNELLKSRSDLRVAYAEACLKRAKTLEASNASTLLIAGAQLGGDDIVDSLAELVEGGALKESATRALGETGSFGAVTVLLRMHGQTADEAEKKRILGALNELELSRRAEAVAEHMKALGKTEDIVWWLREARPLFAGSASSHLDSFLASKNPMISVNAALALAEHRRAEAVPLLVKLVVDEVRGEEARRTLQRLTFRESAATTPEEIQRDWQAWWKKNEERGPDAWFADALEEDGLRSVDLGPWLRGETDDPRVLSLMLTTLRSDRWSLRLRAAEILAAVRGAAFGDVGRDVSPEDLARTGQLWTDWYREWLKSTQ